MNYDTRSKSRERKNLPRPENIGDDDDDEENNLMDENLMMDESSLGEDGHQALQDEDEDQDEDLEEGEMEGKKKVAEQAGSRYTPNSSPYGDANKQLNSMKRMVAEEDRVGTGREPRAPSSRKKLGVKQQPDESRDSSSSKSQPRSQTNTYLLVIIVCCLVAFVAYWNSDANKDTRDDTLPLNPWTVFSQGFDREIRPKYKAVMPGNSYKVIRASVKSTLDRNKSREEEMKQPSVLLLLGSKAKPVKCLAEDLGRLISTAYGDKLEEPTIIEGQGATADEVNNGFQHNFHTLKRRYIIINGVHKLEGKAALSLHRFTDHNLAIFLEAVVILIGYTDDTVSLDMSASLKEMDKLAIDLLEKSWRKSLTEDIVGALVSRLTDSVAALVDPRESPTIC